MNDPDPLSISPDLMLGAVPAPELMVGLAATVLIVLLGSALCSGTEAALFSTPHIQIKTLAEEGSARAKKLLGIKEALGRPIATIVILNNIFNIVGSIIIGGMAAEMFDSAVLGIFTAVVTFLVIVFSEIIPKTIGERHCLKISLAAAGPIRVLTTLFSPVIWLIERFTGSLDRTAISHNIREQELKLLAKDSHKAGSISRWESDLIQRVFQLKEKTAGELMTPRVAMTSLEGSSTLAESEEKISASVHSRIVVVGEAVDDVLGVALKDELLRSLIAGSKDRSLAELVRPVHVVPTSVSAQELLTSFRSRREHLHIVSDEFGGVAGVVTLEDVLEELTGEILDETDVVADLQEEARREQQSRSEGVR
jgi:CBS domain containing-hemolysin-like protein